MAAGTQQRAYRRILDEILDAISRGQLAEGERLPTERQLALEYKVSRPTVREALRVLHLLGIINTRVGAGSFVLPGAPEKARQSDDSDLQQQKSPDEVLEARLAVEPILYETAAKNWRAGDLDAAEQALQLMQRECERQGVYSLEADYAFHSALVGACHNGLLADIMAVLFDADREKWYHSARNQVLADRAYALQSLSEHRLLLEVIRTRNVRLARSLSRKQIETWIRRLRKR